ncbi:MAG: S-layer homology domain-containing protein, partial [Oscillospiraceae bacterium]
YAAGYEGEYVNLTADPDNVPWERFIGKNGIGIYDWGGNPGTGYYIPSQNCKMQYLSNGETVYDLCEVCQEQMRKALCADSNVTKLFFQTYADEFVAGEVPDMRQYFILRRGSQEVTGDKLGDALTLTYYDADNKALPGVPQDVGTYTVKAEFAGNDQFGACTVTGTFDVVLVGISLRAYSKVEDGTPAKLDIEVKYDGDYIVDLYFEGTQSNYGTYVYTSYYDNWDDTYYVYRWVYSTNAGDYVIDEEYVTDSEPTEAADYAVTVTVYDEYGEDIIGEKTAYYTISTKCKTLLNNDSDYYYGATPYANNQNIIIYGEGFTLEEQDKFDALAKQLMDGIMATEPFKETKLYFDVVSVNTVSRESGIGPDGSPKDTFFRLTYDAKGKIIPSYDATYSASYLAYSFAGYQGATIVIVNDKNATGCDTYYSSSFDQGGYHLFSTVYVTPNDKNWTAYAAQEVLNHLTWHEAGYTADNWFKQAQQRLELLDYMYYEDTEYNACAPIIVSRAYDMTFVANGRPVDLEPYFQVYRGKEVLPGVDLNLTYYDAKGNVLEGAPSEPGTYSVLAETVPYDPDPSNPNESYWAYYMPAGYTDYEDALWLGMARGYTTFTILPSSGGVGGGSGATNDLPFADIGTNHVFHDYIQYVYEYGIMNGRTATYFDATSPLTRGQLAATLYRMAGSPDISDEILGYPFSDVDAESYYSNAIYWARLNGIVDGYEDGSFRPNAPVSRQAMMTILYRYAESLGLDVSVSSSNNLAKFQDGGQVSSVMTDAVNWAVEKGFVSGNTAGLLNPTGSTTRGAAAKILAGFHQDYIA